MHLFSFIYQSQKLHASVEHYIIDGYDRYRISHDDGFCFIMISRRPNIFNKITWTQVFNQGEHMEPQEKIQAMGDGLLAAGIQTAVNRTVH